jgi:FkbM family methyltransferase
MKIDFKKLRRNLKRGLRSAFGYKMRNFEPKSFGSDPFNDVMTLSIDMDRKVDCIFDVGAHVGATSKELLSFFSGAKVHAFEPHGASYKRLLSEVSHPRFTGHHLALSDKAGSLQFYEYGLESTVNSLVPNAQYAVKHGATAVETTVVATTTDTFCDENKIDHISLLKIDTEGNDLNVLKGAKNMLSQGKIDFIYFEFNDFEERAGSQGGSLCEIGRFLAPYQFHFVATYTDYVVTKGSYFAVANALAVRAV